MNKWTYLIPIFFLLSGCVTSTTQTQQELADDASFKSREELLLSTSNSEKLIEFYKESLRETESSEVRIKLVSAYVDAHDYDSAAFHVDQIVPSEDQQAQVLFLKAKISFAQGDMESALVSATSALEHSPKMAETENLLGLIWAEKENYAKAREYFVLSRSHFFDDIIIKNNLAVVDLIEGNYQSAINKLQPIYQKGVEDPQVLSNLVLAYAKAGMYQPMEQILKDQKYTRSQIQQIYIALRKTESNQKKVEVIVPELKVVPTSIEMQQKETSASGTNAESTEIKPEKQAVILVNEADESPEYSLQLADEMPESNAEVEPEIEVIGTDATNELTLVAATSEEANGVADVAVESVPSEEEQAEQ